MCRNQNTLQFLVGMRNNATSVTKVQRCLKKLRILVPHDLALSFLGIYPKSLKLKSHKGIFTPMFTAAVCTVAMPWKKPTCPSMDK